ncbi:MAG TPA: CDP-alcohol phosphatidyltransferase family protein [Candidatus Saccharimonadales bacterium]
MDRTAAENYRRIQRGNRLQRSADALCHARRIGGLAVGTLNLFTPYGRTLAATAAVMTVYATDKLDGMLARRGANLLGRPTTPEGKKLDQSVDKQTHLSIAGSQAIQAYMRGQWVFGTVIMGNLIVQRWRDGIVNSKRELAAQVALATGEPIHTGSIPSSQRKLAAQAAADIGTESPLAELASGRAALGVTHCVCTKLSITSGAEVLDQLNAGIKDGLKILQPRDPVDSQDDVRPDPEDSELWHELSLLAQTTRSERLLGRFACLLGYQDAGQSLPETA